MRPAELFRHCPRCAAPRPDTGGVPVTCDACGLCLFLNPAVAAAAFVSGPAGVLFLRRAHDPERGKLACPGGFLDPGETAEDGLRRETLEEVGVAIDHIEYVGSRPNLYPYRGVDYPVLDLVFRATAVDPDTARPLDGAAGIEWRDLAGVDPAELAFESLRFGLAALRGSVPASGGRESPK